MMGWGQGHPCERPTHSVWVDAFLIARTPVTNEEFAAYLAATGTAPPPFWSDSGFADPSQPVVGLSWDEGRALAVWVGESMSNGAEGGLAAAGRVGVARS